MVNGFNSSFYLIYIKAIVHPDGPQYITKMSPVHLTFDAPPPPTPAQSFIEKWMLMRRTSTFSKESNYLQ